jgi:ParB-like chromosome segregation protein Spo0J
MMPTRDPLHSSSLAAKGRPAGPAIIERLPIAALRPNPRNARTHSKAQIRKIAASLRTFGFVTPIVVDETLTILAGHGRLEAARSEGLEQVPVVRLDHLTEAQKRAYVLADNKIAEQAGWDREMLAIELGELLTLLPEEGFDIGLTGFEAAEIDPLIADAADTDPASEDVVPRPPATPVAIRGDLWLLGRHRLLCADARDPIAMEHVMGGERAACVFTDPPYNLRVRDIVGRGRTRHDEFAFASGEMSQAGFRQFLAVTLGHAVEASRPGATAFVCMDWRHIADLIDVGRTIFGDMLNLCVWNKTSPGQGSFYRSQHELVAVFRVGEEPHQNNITLGRFGRNRSNVWTYPGVNSFGPGRLEALAAHPTCKPVQLVVDALLDCTRRGDAVLDPFTGSGTTVMAAERIGRRAFAIEFEPRYIDVAITRWQNQTGLDATLAGDGRTFEEIAASRRLGPPAPATGWNEGERPGETAPEADGVEVG